MLIGRTRRAVALGTVAAALDMMASGTPAFATNVYGGSRYQNAITDMDGTFSYISYGNLTPKTHMCILFGSAIETFGTGTTQSEIGIYSCNANNLDGSCTGGPQKYIEEVSYGAGVCTMEGSIAGSTAISAQTNRTGQLPNGTDVYTSYLNGVQVGNLGNFASAPQIWEGGEPYISGVATFPCDHTWKGSGSWSSIQYRQRSTGAWKTVTAASPISSCMGLTAFATSGGFSAYHS